MTPAEKRTARAILLRAAEYMQLGEYGEYGACYAIYGAGGDPLDRQTALWHLRSLFSNASTYWFGGYKPQWMLEGAAERRAREHRTYALLLAAETLK